jgi:hypothetical protein
MGSENHHLLPAQFDLMSAQGETDQSEDTTSSSTAMLSTSTKKTQPKKPDEQASA